jgi:hypothetical protein
MQTHRTGGTAFLTGPADDTAIRPKHEFLKTVLAFGIIAPKAAQGASLKKNNGPDPRSIVNGISGNVKNYTFRFAL